MSKIGNKPIKILEEIKIEIVKNPSGGHEIIVSGPKGTLKQEIKPGVNPLLKNQELIFEIKDPNNKALQGLYRSLVANMVFGVKNGWNKGLELKGVGFRALVNGNKIILTIGFSHPVEFVLPPGINASVTENKINITGFDKQLVGDVAARIRGLKPPEPYKGKGIRYIGEIVRKKAGKQAIKSGGVA